MLDTMHLRLCCPLLMIIAIFSGCYRQAYFLSPFQANTNFYHAIPSKSDSVKSASYVSGAFTAGAANDYLEDDVFSFHGYFHRSHTFNKLQAYYGINASVGSYDVDENSFYNSYPSDPVNYRTGHKFFGGLGMSGGINLVVPMGARHEWRVIGLQSSLQKEYGNYLQFRKQVPDSAVNGIHRNNVFATAGLTTEFVFNLRNKSTLGYKLSVGSALQSIDRYYSDYNDYYETFVPVYVSNTFRFSRNHVTGFAQVNLGTYAANFQMGFNYLLGGKQK